MNFPAPPDLRDPPLGQQIPEEDLFNLRSAIATVLDAWPLAAGVFAAGIAFGLFKGWATPPLYQSSALIEIESRSSGFAVGPEEFGPASYMTPPAAATQAELLKSRSILGAAAEQLGLMTVVQPRYWGAIGAAMARGYGGEGVADAPWFIPFSSRYAWGGEQLQLGKLVLPAAMSEGLTLVAGEQGSFTLQGSDSGTPLGQGRVGEEASFKAGDGQLEIQVSNLQARSGTEFYLYHWQVKDAADSLRQRMQVTERGARGAFQGSGILEVSVKAGSAREASDSTNAIVNTYLRQNVERLSQGAERKLEFLNSQLPRLQQELEAAEQALLEQRSRSGPYQLSEGAKSILDSLTTLEREISELELQRTELSQTLTPQHPAMASVIRKLDQLRTEKARIDARIAVLPDAESRLLQLTRDSKVSSELYIALLNKAQELKVAKAGTIGNVRIVDTAVPVAKPIEPRKSRLLLSWAALGFIAGLGAVFLRKHLNMKLHWAEDAERRIGIPVYATIPFSPKQTQLDSAKAGGRALLAESEPQDMAVESLRSLRASLHFAMMDAKRNFVVITGSTPNVGKSFVAANLAKLVADADKKVLLIDADLRKGRMHGMFGRPRSPGLSEAIAGQADAKAVRHRIGDSRLWLVTSGKLPPNPAELLASDRFIEVVESACKDFDLVILDTPPILNLADTVLVAKSAGALFVTIRGGVSTVPDVQDCVQRFAKNGIKVDGLIFNGLKPSMGSYVHPQYYHYRYRYSRYGSGR